MKTTNPSTAPAEVPLPAAYIARKFMLSRTTLWRWRKLGLPVKQVRGKLFISERDVVAFIERMNVEDHRRTPKASEARTHHVG